MIVKVLGCILVMLATSLYGYNLSKKLLAAQQLTEGVIGGLTYLNKEIVFSLTLLSEGLLRAAAFAGDARQLFEDAGRGLSRSGETAEKVWKEALDRLRAEKELDPAVYEQLDALGRQLGQGDMENESNTILGCIEKLKSCRDAQHKTYLQKGKLYQKCGVLAGIVIAILMI